MFNLDQAISEWRKQMLAAGVKTPVPLEELEIHLRENIEERIHFGISAQQAFEATSQQIGQATVLKKEFAKVGGPIHERLKHIIFTLAGIPTYQLATNMNTSNSNIEPRWATYLKAATFLFPATILWLFSAVFVLPKANEICQSAGATVFNFPGTPALFKASATVGQVMIFLTRHCVLIGGAIILMFIILESRSRRWPHYRRAAIGTGVFLLNAVVLLSLTTVIISILIAVPVLLHHVK